MAFEFRPRVTVGAIERGRQLRRPMFKSLWVPYLKFISPAGLDYLKRNRYVLEKCERDPKT
jgi:hypothetical protein